MMATTPYDSGALDFLSADRIDLDEAVRLANRLPDHAADQQVRALIGTYLRSLAPIELDSDVGLAAVLRTLPLGRAYYVARGFDARVIDDTFAAVGRMMRLWRARWGVLGVPNWRWVAGYVAGNLFQLGRLQYKVHLVEEAGHPLEGTWVAAMHIAGGSPLSPEAVDQSLVGAAGFVRRHFGELGITMATCDSWLLDPYFFEVMPHSNVAAFSRRFTRILEPVDSQTSPAYFLWQDKHSDYTMPANPTTLERIVCERVAAGGMWQNDRGMLPLPEVPR